MDPTKIYNNQLFNFTLLMEMQIKMKPWKKKN